MKFKFIAGVLLLTTNNAKGRRTLSLRGPVPLLFSPKDLESVSPSWTFFDYHHDPNFHECLAVFTD